MWRWSLVGVAAVSLLAGVALAQGLKPGDVGYPYGDLKEVTLQGRLVDLAAEMAKKYGARTAGAGPEKQWGFATPKGELYTFLDNEAYRKLIAGKPARMPGPRAKLVQGGAIPIDRFGESGRWRHDDEVAGR